MNNRSTLRWIFLVIISLSPILAVACRRVSDQPQASVSVELVAPLSPPPVGTCPLVLRVTDSAGEPLEDLQVSIRGDMTHAGMIPVLATADPIGQGMYRAILDWTMAGDWIVTVEAALQDGSRAVQQFDINVRADGTPCRETE